MNILAIDTSTEACSAAVLRADGQQFSEFEIAPKQHYRLLPQMMDQVLSAAEIGKHELTHCAFANGPGAFTGIRIAAAQAQGISIALAIPLLPVSSLAVLAQRSLDQHDANNTLVALDARMREIYWAVYQRDDSGNASLRGAERLSAIDELVIDDDIECGAGHGWLDELRIAVNFPVDPALLPDAKSLLQLARTEAVAERGIAAEHISINYLRNQVAEKTSA